MSNGDVVKYDSRDGVVYKDNEMVVPPNDMESYGVTFRDGNLYAMVDGKEEEITYDFSQSTPLYVAPSRYQKAMAEKGALNADDIKNLALKPTVKEMVMDTLRFIYKEMLSEDLFVSEESIDEEVQFEMDNSPVVQTILETAKRADALQSQRLWLESVGSTAKLDATLEALEEELCYMLSHDGFSEMEENEEIKASWTIEERTSYDLAYQAFTARHTMFTEEQRIDYAMEAMDDAVELTECLTSTNGKHDKLMEGLYNALNSYL